MQENNPVPTPVVTPEVMIEQPKNNNFLVILLSILLLLSVTIAGFFAFQTQKLVKELNMLRNEELIVKTPAPTVEPVVSPDPTANWKTYSLLTASFKYPQDYYLEPQSTKSNVTVYNKMKGEYYVGIGEYKGSIQDLVKTNAISQNQLVSTKVGKYSGYELKGAVMPGDVSETIYVIDNSSSYFEIRIWDAVDLNSPSYVAFRKNVDQILSTFKFTN
jgi:hypothetical protein